MKKTLIGLVCISCFIGTGCANTPKAMPLDEPKEQAAEVAPEIKPLSPNVAPADVFKTIAANYKGSVTLIDLWATWCPPCRQAMKLVDAIKPALKAKGCKFVYVTGETSPRADFDAMYKSIDGDHYYLTNDQYQYLLKQTQAEGVPHYILLDKAGNILWKNSGYPGNDELQSQVEMALAK